MKTVCTRCKSEIHYKSKLPDKCPRCGASYLFAEKTNEETLSDISRLKLPPKLKNISPATKRRRFMIPLALLIDALWLALGILFALKFYRFPKFIAPILPYAGIALTLGSIYRFIYRAVMGSRLNHAVKKDNITSVDELIKRLAYKTRSDVLVLFKKNVKWGFLIGYGVRNGTEIYKI